MVPFAISAFTIVAVAPLESVIVVVPAEKSIPFSPTTLSPAFVEELSVPSNATLPSAVSILFNNLAPASVESESVPFNMIVLLFPCSSFNISPPAFVLELSVPLRIIVLGLVSIEELVMRVSPTPDNCAELTTELSVKNLCS